MWGYGVSLFTYDNDTFGVYCYTNDGCAPVDFNVHVKGKYSELEFIKDGERAPFWMPASIPALYTRSLKPAFRKTEEDKVDENDYESVFRARIIQEKLRDMSDDDICYLLAGKNEEFRCKLLDNISAGRRTDIFKQEAILKPMRKSDVDKTTSHFLNSIRDQLL